MNRVHSDAEGVSVPTAQAADSNSHAHTPRLLAPWTAKPVEHSFFFDFNILSPDGQAVAAVVQNGGAPWEDVLARARLVAAAPDLLEALDPDTLEAVADEIDCFEHSARAASLRGIAKRQRAAEAKATGEAGQ